MAGRSRGFKVGSILLALLIGTGIIALAGSMLLPSTKRGRVNWDEVRRQYEEDLARSAATMPSTVPTTAPSTAPADAATHVGEDATSIN